jgi:hypothetical protein
MSKKNSDYLDIEQLKFEEDLISRKEFIQYEIEKKDKYEIDYLIKKDNRLLLTNYQKFVTNFINPNTKYNKLLLIHSTGVGKTITALSTAMNFINIYKQEQLINNNHNSMIYIIGFSKSVFKRELFSRPEYGIVLEEEVKEMNELKKQIIKYKNESDINRLKEIKHKLALRLHSKKGNGYFEFIGYKELLNKLFIRLKLDVKIQLNKIKTEEELNYLLDNEIIAINNDFIQKFEKSLVICDEIHNVYNSLDTNNWGIALNMIFKAFRKYNLLRVLLLSATPINNNPIEILSLIKLLNDEDLNISKSDIFDKKLNIHQNGYKLIEKYIKGKISFLKEMDLESYPNKEIHGEEIKDIAYLKFIKCPMSNLHFSTYKHVSNEYRIKNEIENDENEINADEIKKEGNSISEQLVEYPINLELNNRYLNDIVFPNPNNKNIGLFKKNDIIKEITNADKNWKNKFEIDIVKNDKIYKNTITGNLLLENNIKKYSTKYYKLLNLLNNIVINNKGKVFIYHNFVQISGINLLVEILKINGFLAHDDHPTKLSKCNICYKIKDDHNKIKDHEFIPIRFIIINSLYEKHIIEKNLDNFNLNNNINGENIRIILGSKAIKESYTLKEIQNLIILHQPDNISTLIQIFGRAIRKNSHQLLPEKNRKVDIYILVSSIPEYTNKKNKYIYSYEEYKYKFKIDIYKIIQKITNIFIENAIDRNINYNINFPKDTSNTDLYTITKLNKNKLININYNNINSITFNSYYYESEINLCKYMIKRLFIEYSTVWTFDDLKKYIYNPYFDVNTNTKYISEYSIIVALNFLVFNNTNINYITKNENNRINTNLLDNLFNNSEKFIIDSNNNINIIMYIHNYYILMPYNKPISYNCMYNNINYIPELNININKILEQDINLNSYDNIKDYAIKKYSNKLIDDTIITEFDYDFHLKFIEEIIEYFFNLYTDINFRQDINHDLYLKVLYYYTKYNIIIFANKIDKELEELYTSYIIPTNIVNISMSDDYKENYNYNNLIKSLESESNFEPKKYSHFEKFKTESSNFLINKKESIKIFDYLLPIGHIFQTKFKFYHPKKYWFIKLNYNKINIKYEDNPIIIGFLEKPNMGFDIVFKLRKPNINNIKKNDLRLLESGLNCLHKDKNELVSIAKKLNIDLTDIKLRKVNLCNIIKNELIRRELHERKKLTKIKYFYFYWELM